MFKELIDIAKNDIIFKPDNFIAIDYAGLIWDGYSLGFEDDFDETIETQNLKALIWKPDTELENIIENNNNEFFSINVENNFATIINWQGNFVVFTKDKDIIEFYTKVKKDIEK